MYQEWPQVLIDQWLDIEWEKARMAGELPWNDADDDICRVVPADRFLDDYPEEGEPSEREREDFRETFEEEKQ